MGLSHWPVTLNQLKWEVKWKPLFTVNGPSAVWGRHAMRLVATPLHYVPALAIFLHQIYQRNWLQFRTSGCMEFEFQVSNIYHRRWHKMCACTSGQIAIILRSISITYRYHVLCRLDIKSTSIWRPFLSGCIYHKQWSPDRSRLHIGHISCRIDI